MCQERVDVKIKNTQEVTVRKQERCVRHETAEGEWREMRHVQGTFLGTRRKVNVIEHGVMHEQKNVRTEKNVRATNESPLV